MGLLNADINGLVLHKRVVESNSSSRELKSVPWVLSETQWRESEAPRKQMGYGCGCRNKLIYHCGDSLSGNPPRNDHSGLRQWWPLARSGLCIISVTDRRTSSAYLRWLRSTWAPMLHCSKQLPPSELVLDCFSFTSFSSFIRFPSSFLSSIFLAFHLVVGSVLLDMISTITFSWQDGDGFWVVAQWSLVPTFQRHLRTPTKGRLHWWRRQVN